MLGNQSIYLTYGNNKEHNGFAEQIRQSISKALHLNNSNLSLQGFFEMGKHNIISTDCGCLGKKKKRSIQFSAALKNPWLTLSGLLKSSQNIGFCQRQKWGQLPAPLIMPAALSNLAVDRLKGKYEGLLKHIYTPSRHGIRFFPLFFYLFIFSDQGTLMEFIRSRRSLPEDSNLDDGLLFVMYFSDDRHKWDALGGGVAFTHNTVGFLCTCMATSGDLC